MVSTNITTRQSTGVAINVEVLKATLQAIKQRVLRIMVNRQWSARACSLSSERMVNRQWSMVNGQWSITRLYRQELRLARAVARVIDKHPTLSNIALWLMGIGIMVEIFLFV